jgi:pimeloyl-ACP methyl ester carboxylesterase
MSNQNVNERGNHQGEFSQGVGGWAEYTVHMTETSDTVRHDVTVPPGKVIPIIFLPGVMGSNLRMSKDRQEKLKRADNRAWRPDDMVSLSGNKDVVTGTGMGGWFKNASPAQRQLVFDPNETEVEYYHYTESNERFDPEGKETLAADARHQNVPDSLEPIPPLMGQRSGPPIGRGNSRPIAQKKKESAAQIARWRGWSEVLFAGAYSEMLKTAEKYLNNILIKGEINPVWRTVCVEPGQFGGTTGAAISESDLKKIAACWYPVHAMGYNFLKSNGDSAKVIAERVRGLVKGYQKRGFKCEEVILVTHSMGGLVGRALLHPRYGNMLNDKDVKVLGMYHNVMPTIGAGSAYKRMRFGFKEKWGYTASLEASTLAIDGKHATAILANTPAPLELLPGKAYGRDWLKVVDGSGKTLWSWPRGSATVVDSIYLQPDSAWWRLVNPLWVNPAGILEKDGGGLEKVYKRIEKAAMFLDSVENTFHPTSCYASYCASTEHASYGEVVFRAEEVWTPFAAVDHNPFPPAETWKPLTDDAKGTLKVKAGARTIVLYLQKPSAAGDETVPSERSACQINGTLFVHGKEKGKGYEHQRSYSDQQVLTSMLYSIVQIAKTAKWE